MTDKIKGRRLLAAAIIVPVIAAFVLGTGLYPMVHMEAKDVPVAFVSEDKGVSVQGRSMNAGDMIKQRITELGKKNSAVDISLIDDKEKALEDAAKGDYCAVLVLPPDFSAKLMAFNSGGKMPSEIELYINQGNYGLLGTMMETSMTAMAAQLAGAFSQGSTDPVKCSVEYINPTAGMGEGLMSVNGHALAGMITWVTMLVGTVIIYMYGRSTRGADIDKAHERKKTGMQISFGALVSLTDAAAVLVVLKYLMGFDIGLGSTFCYTAIVIFGFMMFILGLMKLIGFGGIVIAALAMFLSIGTIYIPYDALPEFWKVSIYPWAPVRIIGEGFREIFFLDGSCFNRETVIAVIMAATGIALAYIPPVGRRKKPAEEAA